jgi:hypothetical protein
MVRILGKDEAPKIVRINAQHEDNGKNRTTKSAEMMQASIA